MLNFDMIEVIWRDYNVDCKDQAPNATAVLP